MTAKTKKIIQNTYHGWRTTFAGVLMIALSSLYWWAYELHLIYCVASGLTGIGFIVAPDQLKPLFVGLIKSLIGFVTSKFTRQG